MTELARGMTVQVTETAGIRWDTPPMTSADNMIVVGYAKVPAVSASHGTHELFSISLLVDRATDRVTEVDSTAVTSVVRHWLADLLVGANLAEDPGHLLAVVEERYLGQGSGAIRQAITDAWRRYARHREA